MGLISLLKKKNDKTLFTTPSHSGKFFITHKFYNWYKSDISEVDAYNPQDELKKAEEEATRIYKTKYTKFLTNGSTSGIITAVLTCSPKKILIWDNAHICHKNASKLANAEIIEYSLEKNKDYDVFKAITPKEVEKLLSKHSADAIIITSPTYEGYVADVKNISEICKKYKTKLIVDEAHGALYPFSEKLPESAIKYADYTIQSLHKTAGGLNPTALLHSNDLNPEQALSMIQTTSPSYPMLATIEANVRYLNSKKGRKQINNLISELESLNFPHLDDITKIVIKKEDLSGEELSNILFEKYKIEDERTSKKSSMLLCGLGTDKKKLLRLRKVLNDLGI